MLVQQLLCIGVIALLVLTIPTAVSAQTPKIPVIVLFKDDNTENHEKLIKEKGGDVKRSFKIIHGSAAKLSQSAIDELKKDPNVSSVSIDAEVKALDSISDTQIRANQVWAAGDTGQGVPVAILDTGIVTTHPEFAGRIALCHSEKTTANTCEDQNGHGTHVAGIVAAAGINLNAKGVSPAAVLYIDQVLDSTGSGLISDVIAGIDWARTNNAKVISMSLGTSPVLPVSSPNCDSYDSGLTSAINNAVAAGITVVAAAGNSGTSGVGAPACISSTIAVAAVDGSNTIASFSSQGGAVADHGIAAPGVNIFSSYLSGNYATLSGTSMATPQVAGAVALLLKANPALSPAAIKSTLFNSACSSSTSPSCPTGIVPNSVYGYGRVDALSAYGLTTVPNPPAQDPLTSTAVGGTGIPIDGVALFLYGFQSYSFYMLPVISGIAAGLVVLHKKNLKILHKARFALYGFEEDDKLGFGGKIE